jgi:hypothetical protein
MNNAHTPAPWNLNGNGILLHPVTNAQLVTQRIETSLGSFEVLDETNEPEANAHLISAAPDLLSALESLAVWNDGEPCFCHVHGESERARYTPHDSYCDKAREALHKAKGEA